MTKTRVLTGITTTGTPHLGNYVGAIKPAIEASQDPTVQSFYFLADFHALIKCQDPKRVQESRREIAATWLALGLDTDNAIFYRQSDVPEIPELMWLLNCVCAKGLMNRAHAYKGAVAENEESGIEDLDRGISMGLFSYPVLMAADILMFNAHKVPVGRDQIQHIEMARDMAGRFNHLFKGNYFTMPEAVTDEKSQLLLGLDGRKMSKSYNNTIPLFGTEKQLLKSVRKIKTNSLEPGEPKDPDTCSLFQIYSAFATEAEVAAMREQYAAGIGWGDAKNQLFEYLNDHLKAPRERYVELMEDPAHVEAILKRGAERAREEAAPMMERLRRAVGLGNFI
ncbi:MULTISPECIES: tryptophan--tRNA ligase [Cobetia]|jgi:tryptophanyl-tRNA synthetase|uniref:tryptophan--tRNA ligase n=1 Tax=Cobetia TaxID=204286 RepID=UPI000D1A8942|nr:MULTISPECIES: tryptophan--tRNA ligase [Cobetia]AVV34418.1 tryptophan--tRNA ligase [Halomonas sp. SF2003]MBE2169758.1 tryptophan--tRNA ligase [Cobetia sp. 2AS1]MBS4152710.1 tryptophan--tRNA ligase [Cobetia sp. MC34]MBU3008061.1 tryptophan--tRNA ligase [Cobetia amphilecti]MDH2295705.1 tryptophan--tRNA ligase [Cobetia sp. 1AS1]|tara:strand:+ start:83 stop:1096 length:1014 start_codon:yes stop_codon:yes gene_type:complete